VIVAIALGHMILVLTDMKHTRNFAVGHAKLKKHVFKDVMSLKVLKHAFIKIRKPRRQENQYAEQL
jgi:hypothetical protein